MRIPKYWAQAFFPAEGRGGKTTLSCWRWSDVSLEDPHHPAAPHVPEIPPKYARDEKLNRYSYGERPFREEVVQSIKSSDGRELAIVTRNNYGALVLNTARAMFIDIDFDQKEQDSMSPSLADKFRSLFGKPKP